MEHGDEVEERGHEPEVVDQRNQRSAGHDDGDWPMREQPSPRLPREENDDGRMQRERDDAGNEVRLRAAQRQHAVVRREVLAREEARGDPAPQERKAAEVDDHHRPFSRLPPRHGSPFRSAAPCFHDNPGVRLKGEDRWEVSMAGSHG
jgi:hypothetical protein